MGEAKGSGYLARLEPMMAWAFPVGIVAALAVGMFHSGDLAYGFRAVGSVLFGLNPIYLAAWLADRREERARRRRRADVEMFGLEVDRPWDA